MVKPAVNAVRTLLCHRDVEMMIGNWATLLACSQDVVATVIHDDGSLTPEDITRLESTLPGCRVMRRSEADALMVERLKRHPHAAAFRAGSVWGLKLLDVVLAEAGDCYYVDADIRFLRPFHGLFTREALAGRSVFLHDTVWHAYSIRPWHLLDHRRLRVVGAINTGLTLIDRSVFDLDYVDWFLAQADWRVIPAWTEPTCWAALGTRTNAHVIDRMQVTNLYPSARTSDHTVGVHLLSASRDRFRALANREPSLTLPAQPIRFERATRLGAIGLSANLFKRKVMNEFARRRAKHKTAPFESR